MKTYGLIFILVGLLLAACSQQGSIETLETQSTNYWKKLGDALDIIPKHNVAKAKLILDRNDKPVVVWAEDNGLWYLQAKRWNGTAWEKLALPPLDLAYTDYGVRDFDAVFDSTNTLMVSQVVADGIPDNKVEIYRSTSSSWTRTARFYGLEKLRTNSRGQVHALFYGSTVSRNIIKRWDGTAWRTAYTFDRTKTLCDEICYHLGSDVDEFAFKSDGKPVIRWDERVYLSGWYIYNYSSWNGTAWVDIAESPVDGGRMAIDKNNKLIYGTANSVVKEGVGNLGYVDSTYDYSLTSDNQNRPIRAISFNLDIVVNRWTGTKWQQLGGSLDRTPSENASTPQILVGTDGTYYVAWLEAACTNAATCGGADLYVSKYVP